MAVTYTLTYADNSGPICTRSGTFTSAAGDGNGETLTATTHGLNYLVEATISLDTGAIDAQPPKVAISSGTVTWTVDDTRGLSGRWLVRGRP